MRIEYDADKRQATLDDRGLDFDDMKRVLDGFYLVRTDDRRDYGETRYVTLGALENRPVVCVWTPRDGSVRVISMRHADDEEREIYWRELEQSG